MTDADKIRRFQVLHARHLAAVAASVGQAWDDLGSYNETDLKPWFATVLPLLDSSHQQMASLVDSYIAGLASTEPLGVLAPQPRTTDARDVYKRPFFDVWAALASGRTWESAVNSGRSRAVSLAQLDTQLVMRAVMDEIARIHADEPDTVRRVPRLRVSR